MILDRLFTELTPEVDYTVQMYAKGKEKKEIAEIKCRALATINNQIKTAFEVLNVRNGRELSILYMIRRAKIVVAILFFSIITLDVAYEAYSFYNNTEVNQTIIARRNRRIRKGKEWDLDPLLV